MALKMEHSTGNVFEDVGFPPDVAANLLLRSELTVQILRIIEGNKLTQQAAAKLFGVTQPRISDLVRGRIERFSIDGLVNMLAAGGTAVELTTRQNRKATGQLGAFRSRSTRSTHR